MLGRFFVAGIPTRFSLAFLLLMDDIFVLSRQTRLSTYGILFDGGFTSFTSWKASRRPVLPDRDLERPPPLPRPGLVLAFCDLWWAAPPPLEESPLPLAAGGVSVLVLGFVAVAEGVVGVCAVEGEASLAALRCLNMLPS